MNVKELTATVRRRTFLKETAYGLGTIALAKLLADEGHAGRSAEPGSFQPPRAPHYAAKAKNVIFIFMAGGPSQLDLFDPKPAMRSQHQRRVPDSFLKGLDDALIRGSARVFASPRTFTKYGECGMEFSDYVPHLGTCADDICMIRSMQTDVSNHHPAQLMMNCGAPHFGLPSFGSWVTYGLGSQSQELPGFVVMLSNSGKGVDGGSSLWTNGFLPSTYRGVTFRSKGDAILHLTSPKGIQRQSQRARLDAVRDLNEARLRQTGDPEIAARIASYELAFRMQSTAPELLDVSQESAHTLKMYGIQHEKTKSFGSNCLLARRMVERGVRFVQLYHSTWDDHNDLNKNLKTNCDMTDQPAAALLKDLKQRGLLDETLVVWGGEFGRTPMNEVRRGNIPGKEGRDHHPFAFTVLMAGGGTQGGQIFGKTDELGYHPSEDALHVHDLQATMLHCLGFDHEKLTYFHRGREFRLTDVAGNVATKLLA